MWHNSINSKRGYSWESNPWVWVIEFKRGEAMRLVQDAANGILPTPDEAKEAVAYLSKLLPDIKIVVCSGAVGDWRMLPNGSTCFYCPPISLPDKIEVQL